MWSRSPINALARACKELATGRVGAAIKTLERHPEPDTKSKAVLAFTYLEADRPSDAVGLLEPHLRHDDRDHGLDAQLHCLLARGYLAIGDGPAAEAQLRMAADLSPGCPVAAITLAAMELDRAAESGSSCLRLQDIADAVRGAVDEARAEPRASTSRVVAAAFRLPAATRDAKAIVKLRLGDLETAKSLLDAALAIDGRFSSAHLHYAQLLLEQARSADDKTRRAKVDQVRTRLHLIALLERRDSWVAQRARALDERLDHGIPDPPIHPDTVALAI